VNEAKKLCKDVLIKPFEGLAKRLPDGRVQAYPDPGTRGHPWTIGWGATGPDINPGTIWTMQQCEEALDHHIEYFVQGITKLSPKIQTDFSGCHMNQHAVITATHAGKLLGRIDRHDCSLRRNPSCRYDDGRYCRSCWA